MPCARRRLLLVLLSGKLATCVVIDEDFGEELEIGSFITSSAIRSGCLAVPGTVSEII